jgi:hypothetical protein
MLEDAIGRAEKALDHIDKQRRGGESPSQGRNPQGSSSLVSLSYSDLKFLVDAAKGAPCTP